MLLLVIIILDDGVIWDASGMCVRRCYAGVQGRALPDIPEPEGVIFLDNLAVDVWEEEQA